jgi:hypothetical protein
MLCVCIQLAGRFLHETMHTIWKSARARHFNECMNKTSGHSPVRQQVGRRYSTRTLPHRQCRRGTPWRSPRRAHPRPPPRPTPVPAAAGHTKKWCFDIFQIPACMHLNGIEASSTQEKLWVRRPLKTRAQLDGSLDISHAHCHDVARRSVGHRGGADSALGRSCEWG